MEGVGGIFEAFRDVHRFRATPAPARAAHGRNDARLAHRQCAHARGPHRAVPPRRDVLASRQGAALDEAIGIELKRDGLYAEYVAKVEGRDRALAALGVPNPSLEDAGVDARALLPWYRERFRDLRGGIEAHAKERGFVNVAAFLAEVVKAYCAEQKAAGRE
jgi:hypothetical protein